MNILGENSIFCKNYLFYLKYTTHLYTIKHLYICVPKIINQHHLFDILKPDSIRIFLNFIGRFENDTTHKLNYCMERSILLIFAVVNQTT